MAAFWGPLVNAHCFFLNAAMQQHLLFLQCGSSAWPTLSVSGRRLPPPKSHCRCRSCTPRWRTPTILWPEISAWRMWPGSGQRSRVRSAGWHGCCHHKKTHAYWHQVEGQLHLTDRDLSYFVVWTTKEALVIPIPKDPAWGQNLVVLEVFYRQHILPVLISREDWICK